MTTDANATRGSAELERLALAAARELEEATAEEIIAWTAATFGNRWCTTSSMEDAVTAHLVSRVAPGADVVFIDTGYHFPETIGTRDAVEAVYDVRLVTVRPELTVLEQDATYGPMLHDRDPDLCCAMRKVAPLEKALAPYDAWVTGLRREDSPSRADTPVVGWDARRGKVKVAPIARWTQHQVDAYVDLHGVLVNPLLGDGYGSIGCEPCTRRLLPGEDARAGRWAGRAKTECGIHA